MNQPLLSRIVAASVNISRKAARIIRDVKISGMLDTKEKAKNDYVTKADFEAQMCIIKSLEKQFPRLKFCGEEGDLKGDYLDIETKLNEDVLTIAETNNLSQYNLITEEELSVWIDPLDGTREFAMGEDHLHEVTVLIGVSWKGRPIAGIMNQPFYSRNMHDKEGDRVIWGICGLGAFDDANKERVFKQLSTWETLKNYRAVSANPKRRIVTTRSHITELLQSALYSIPNAEIIHAGGSGYKTLNVIEGNADCYLYPRSGTKRWDTCAPEAILMSVGGKLTDIFNVPYDYDIQNGGLVENSRGVVATLEDHDFYLSNLSEEIQEDVKKNENNLQD